MGQGNKPDRPVFRFDAPRESFSDGRLPYLERDEVRLNHLMAENRFIRQGASRSAMQSIGQAAQQ